MVHLRFVCELYQEQVDAGRYFLHEHPAGATSWAEACIQELLSQPGVETAVCDRCQYGQVDDRSGDTVKKPTKWMPNSHCIRESLEKRCTGQGGACSRRQGGVHRTAEGRVCKASAIYPFKFRKAIFTGCRRQLVMDRRLVEGVVGAQRPEEEMSYELVQKAIRRKGIVEDEYVVLAMKAGEAEFCDSVTGQPLGSRV